MWVDPKLRGGDDDQHVNKANWIWISFHSFYLPDFVLIHLWVESLLSGLKVCYISQEKNQSYHMCVTKLTNNYYTLQKRYEEVHFTTHFAHSLFCSSSFLNSSYWEINNNIIMIEVLSNFCIWLDQNSFWMLEMRKLCVYIIISIVSTFIVSLLIFTAK